MTPTLSAHIDAAFHLKAAECEINGKKFFIEPVTGGWAWRDGEGNCQEEYGLRPYTTAAECQQSAIQRVQYERWRDLQGSRTKLFDAQPRIHRGETDPQKVKAYEVGVKQWLADMRDMDRKIDRARRVMG